MNTIKAIETRYKGYRFRSRLEARWAVFFDALGIKWEYEPEGFELPSGLYLPDFRLYHEYVCWIEIKPTLEKVNEEVKRLWDFEMSMKYKPDWQEFQILCGNPWPGEYGVAQRYHPWDETQEKKYVISSEEVWTECPLCGLVTIGNYYHDKIEDGLACMSCDARCREWKQTKDTYFHKGIVYTKRLGFICNSPKLSFAYNKSRAARFEHGERP